VIGIDMTDEMLEKARKNAADNGYTNVEFRRGDIEERIPVEENSVDVVISNCVINLTTDKVKTFRENIEFLILMELAEWLSQILLRISK